MKLIKVISLLSLLIGSTTYAQDGEQKIGFYLQHAIGPTKSFLPENVSGSNVVAFKKAWSNFGGVLDSYDSYSHAIILGMERKALFAEVGLMKAVYGHWVEIPRPDKIGLVKTKSFVKVTSVPIKFGYNTNFGRHDKLCLKLATGFILTSKNSKESWSKTDASYGANFTKSDSAGNEVHAYAGFHPRRFGFAHENNFYTWTINPKLSLALNYQITKHWELGVLYDITFNGFSPMVEFNAIYQDFNEEEQTYVFLQKGGQEWFALTLTYHFPEAWFMKATGEN